MKKKLSFIICLSLLFLSACDHHKIIAQTKAPVILTTLNGVTTDLAKLNGKWVFINYWASWCAPCFKEIPELNKFSEAYPKQVLVFGVSYDQVTANILPRIIAKMDIKFPTLKSDPARELGIDNVPGLPATYVINPQGKVVKELLGVQTVASLKQETRD